MQTLLNILTEELFIASYRLIFCEKYHIQFCELKKIILIIVVFTKPSKPNIFPVEKWHLVIWGHKMQKVRSNSEKEGPKQMSGRPQPLVNWPYGKADQRGGGMEG